MEGEFTLKSGWVLAIVAACSAYTPAPTTSRADHATVAGNQTSDERLVDAYQTLRDVMSRQLSASYPVPPKYFSSFQNIRVAFEPLQIITLDEVLQSISISSAFTLTWRDPNIAWDPKTFEGIQWIKLQSSYFWLPNIIIPETTVDDGSLKIPSVLDVSFNGYITVLIPTITTTLCDLDLTYFPFDDQNCTLALIESEFYNMTSQIVNLGDMSKYFGTNAAWQLIRHECHPQTSTTSEPPFNYVSCHVLISRRSAFYVVNLIGPMAMTSLMTLIAFCVPAEGGEKVSFIVSMFMSTSVFYNYIINITPRSMEDLPRVNILLVAIAVQIIFATAAIVFVLIRYNKAKKTLKRQGHLTEQEALDARNTDIPKYGTVGPPYRSRKRKLKNSAATAETGFEGTNMSDQATASQPQVTSDRKAEASKKECPRSLNCDELDMLFFCIMCVLTLLLYLCIFLV